jgi:B12 binding domain
VDTPNAPPRPHLLLWYRISQLHVRNYHRPAGSPRNINTNRIHLIFSGRRHHADSLIPVRLEKAIKESFPRSSGFYLWSVGLRNYLDTPKLEKLLRAKKTYENRIYCHERRSLPEPKLMDLGLTLPGFVQRSKVIASLPSLGLLTLAGLTPENWETTYIEVADINSLGSLPGNFDLVAISSFTAQIKEAYKLADRYRAAGVKVALGGLHVTACPLEAAQHADTIVIGEGEPVWPELLFDLERNRLKPVYNAKGRSFNLAEAKNL